MGVEFTTLVKDYNFSNIPEKMMLALKASMINTLLFEKVTAHAFLKPNIKFADIIENQNYWHLI